MTTATTAPDPSPANLRREFLTALARLEGRVDFHLAEIARRGQRRG